MAQSGPISSSSSRAAPTTRSKTDGIRPLARWCACGGAIVGLGDVDLNSMSAAAVAQHLLKHGITAAAAAPPKPVVKRRLALSKQQGGEDAESDGNSGEDGSSERPSKRRMGGGRGKRSGGVVQVQGLELLRAATIRHATDSLVEAAAAAAEEADESPAKEHGSFSVDALTLLAESSEHAHAGCRSPRMLDAAMLLGGVFSFSGSADELSTLGDRI